MIGVGGAVGAGAGRRPGPFAGFRPAPLFALRRLQARSAVRALRRDRWAWAVPPVAAALAVLVGMRLPASEPPGFGAGLLVETALGAAAVWVTLRLLDHADAGRTAEGCLGDRVLADRHAALWRCAQAAVVLPAPWLLVTAGAASASPMSGLRLAGAVAVGSVLAAVADAAAGRSSGYAAAVSATSASRAGRLSRRGGRLLATALLVAVGTAATALAHRNNPDAALAFALLGASGLVAGAALGAVDLPLLRFLGRQPTPLRDLLLRFAVAPALATGAGVGVAGLAAGLPAPAVGATAGAAALVLAAYACATVLHALGGKDRLAAAAAAMELALLAAVAATAAPAAPAWAVLRAVVLTSSARRRRWLEC